MQLTFIYYTGIGLSVLGGYDILKSLVIKLKTPLVENRPREGVNALNRSRQQPPGVFVAWNVRQTLVRRIATNRY